MLAGDSTQPSSTSLIEVTVYALDPRVSPHRRGRSSPQAPPSAQVGWLDEPHPRAADSNNPAMILIEATLYRQKKKGPPQHATSPPRRIGGGLLRGREAPAPGGGAVLDRGHDVAGGPVGPRIGHAHPDG